MLLWFKEGGVHDLEESFKGLSANISHQALPYYDNIVLSRYNIWKASENFVNKMIE